MKVGDIVRIKNVPNIQAWFRGKKAKIIEDRKDCFTIQIIRTPIPYKLTILKEGVEPEQEAWNVS